ncbi:hypothetical protein D7X33_52730 [Butyricicoccus sp. 1XD8-22]|nr:hypothetical protein D7X33_52730 [Butyricicoccus sp. 1XD8-22]
MKGSSIPPSALDGRSVQGSNIPTSDLNAGEIENNPIHSNFESPKDNLNRDNPAPEQKPKPKVEQPKVKVEQPKVEQPKKAPVNNKVDINSPSFVETDRSNINELNNTSYQEIETEKLD